MDKFMSFKGATWRSILWPAQGKSLAGAFLAFSLALHVWHLGFPNVVAFDESLVGNFAHAYLSGQYVFDIHPPHMKLIYAAIGWLFGMPSVNPFELGRPYAGSFYVAMRALPAMLGALIPWVGFGLARQLGCAKAWAWACAGLLLFDTATMASSQLILNDVPMLFFGLAGWWFFGVWRLGGPRSALPMSAFFLACALGVKWTALGFLLPVAAILAIDATRQPWRASLRSIGLIAAVISAHQLAGYAIHFSLLDKPGPGLAFMSPSFQEDFASKGAPSWRDPIRLARAAVELNQTMASYAGRVPEHPYGSAWHQWPLGRKAIYAWTDEPSSSPARIYVQPNVATWWLGLAGIAALWAARAARAFSPRVRRRLGRRMPQEALLAFAWAANWLPFAFIGRVMFVYHYYPALVVSLIAMAWMASRARAPAWLAAVAVFASAAMFFWMCPWAYGLPLTEAAHQSRQALAFWP